ncbi:DUF2922 domain-containing protein [Vagococcus silagei]|uniref:DUF2922 domain-containing protein n=1 Tax=Vagococcus silagei TaxID=2508885 RepID=A0A4S3B7A3_9ENTE|nr:DUF2922 domain-containing protein [Vagococcus silagei]THB60575.1 DUF2922 domain-containing protein [Vagococcus silagei]
MDDKELTEVLQMEFKDFGNKIRRIKLANPRADLTKEEIEAIMTRIADSQYVTDWTSVRPYKAKIVRTEVSEIVTIS